MEHIGFNYEPTRFEPFVILAVTTDAMSDHEKGTQNALFQLWLLSAHIPFKPLEGRYAGQSETAYLIRETAYAAVAASGFLDDQESVLHLSEQAAYRHGQRTATLVFFNCDEPSKVLGFWTNISKTDALAKAAYTFDPMHETYWATTPIGGKQARLAEMIAVNDNPLSRSRDTSLYYGPEA